MKRYISEAAVNIHPPAKLQLTKDQVRRRPHLLNEVDVEQGIYELTGSTTFKAGEKFGYDGDLPKATSRLLSDDGGDQEDEETDVVDDEKIARIMGAIGDLDPETDDFTGGGLPQVKAIEAILDEDITSAERDIAWQQYQEEQSQNETGDGAE